MRELIHKSLINRLIQFLFLFNLIGLVYCSYYVYVVNLVS